MNKQPTIILYSTLVTLACLFSIPGCQTKTNYNFELEQEARLSSYQTFAIIPIPLPMIEGESDLVQQRIKDIVNSTLESELKNKGYTQVDIKSANFAINVAGKILPKANMIDFGYVPYDSYSSLGAWEHYHPYLHDNRDIYVDDYEEGTLIIEIYDTETRKPVWVGWTNSRLGSIGPYPELLTEKISSIVAAFPDRIQRQDPEAISMEEQTFLELDSEEQQILEEMSYEEQILSELGFEKITDGKVNLETQISEEVSSQEPTPVDSGSELTTDEEISLEIQIPEEVNPQELIPVDPGSALTTNEETSLEVQTPEEVNPQEPILVDPGSEVITDEEISLEVQDAEKLSSE